MRSRTTGLFEIAIFAGVSLILLGPAPAWTQPAPGPSAGLPSMASYDPPARVGRLARISGTVTFHAADQDHWEPASLNYPITSGNALWTEPGATAQLEVASNRIVLGARTELDIDSLGDRAMGLTQPQGVLYIRLRDLAPGETAVVRTPRGTVTIAQPGRYEIVAGDTDHPTLVTVAAGMARITGDNLSIQVAANQTATLVGTDTFTGTVGTEIVDEFLRAQLAAEAPPPRNGTPVEIVQMTGAEVLATTGEWAPTEDYGDVWYPPVESSWVPYRDGNWAYVAPWGWTWVAAEPWGFAPSHYGRWVEVGSRWGWTPERDRRFGIVGSPVYAPALVRWLNVSRGVNAGFERPVGWVPLGPRERFVPWYRSSQAYVRTVNRTDSTVVTTTDQFMNRRGATIAPMAIVAASQRVNAHVPSNSGALLASARPSGKAGPRPTVATAGVTPALARRVRLDPAPVGFTSRPVGPGPVFQPRGPGLAANNRPALRSPNGAPMMQPVAERPEGHGPAPNADRGPDAAAIAGGAAVGGAVAGGAAALFNRQGGGGLPPLAPPRGPGAPASIGGAPGPAIMPRAEPGGGPVTGQPSRAAVPPNAGLSPGNSPPAIVNERPATTPGGPRDTRGAGEPSGRGTTPAEPAHIAGPQETPRPGGAPGSAVTNQTPAGAGNSRDQGRPPQLRGREPSPGQIQPPQAQMPQPRENTAPPPQVHVPAQAAPLSALPAPGHSQAAPPPRPWPAAPPQIRASPPQAHPVSPPPQAQIQAAPPPRPRPAPPPPQVHVQAPPPPQARPAPPPPPQARPVPPPPQVHMQAPPPPQARPAPPPPQVQAARAAPPPTPHPAPAAPPAGHPPCPPGKHC